MFGKYLFVQNKLAKTLFCDDFMVSYHVEFQYYVSVNSKRFHPPLWASPGKFSKAAKFALSPGQAFCQIPGSWASLGPLILKNVTLFHHFKTLINYLPTEYLQICKENIDLSIKNM